LTFNNFIYAFVSGSVSIPDTSITVTPSLAPDMVNLTFTSPDFSVSGTNSYVYQLGYTYDSGEPFAGMDDILNASTPVFPGFAQITTEDCENSAFVGVSCPTTTDTIVVSDNGITLNSPASVTFSPPFHTLGILDRIELEGNGASSEITGFGTELVVPEPSTVAPCLLLLALLVHRRRF
jgi:hypothetical protein